LRDAVWNPKTYNGGWLNDKIYLVQPFFERSVALIWRNIKRVYNVGIINSIKTVNSRLLKRLFNTPTPTIRRYWLDCQINLFILRILSRYFKWNQPSHFLHSLYHFLHSQPQYSKSFNPFCWSHCFIESYIRKIRPNMYKDFQHKMSAFFTIFDSPESLDI